MNQRQIAAAWTVIDAAGRYARDRSYHDEDRAVVSKLRDDIETIKTYIEDRSCTDGNAHRFDEAGVCTGTECGARESDRE